MQVRISKRLESSLAFDAPVSRVPSVSTTRARALLKLKVRSVRDLLSLYPRRYVDMSCVVSIAAAEIGQNCTIYAKVHEAKVKKPRRNLSLTELCLVDGTSTLIVTAFRQPWLANKCKPGTFVAVSGELEFAYGFKGMTNPYIDILESQNAPATGAIVPVHPLTGDIKAGTMRNLMRNALHLTRGVFDPLPLDLRLRYKFMSRQNALSCIHFPHSMQEQAQARRRLAYEEVFLLQLQVMQNSALRAKDKKPVEHCVDGRTLSALRNALPFELSSEQKLAVSEILSGMHSPCALNHLLLGDVGTGKTIVAAFALAAVHDSKSQAMLMAPTEILAQQHAKSLGDLFDKVGLRSALLTSSTIACERDEILQAFAQGEIDVLIGTHSLIEPDVHPKFLSLVVIDEQQRFGVEQRKRLLKKGECPDVLYLTATPIPRTLALTLFGDLSLSYLTQRPYASPKRTTQVHLYATKGKAYDAALEACKRGEQVYVVCPLVGVELKKSGESSVKGAHEHFDVKHGADARARGTGANSSAQEDAQQDRQTIQIEDESDMNQAPLAAAKEEAAFLQAKVFMDYKVGLLHGKLKSAEKEAVMEAFRAGEIDVLVCTTVIEVGVDVPNATIMIVEDADRFGLSQLHQLRGRVGRGSKAAQVHLISGTKDPEALKRLAAMEDTDDGFKLALHDLSLRREGDILGNRQHGASRLRLVNVVRDADLIQSAWQDAHEIIVQDPYLESASYKMLAQEISLLFDRDSDIA